MVNLSKVLIRKEEYEKQIGVELPFVLHGKFYKFYLIFKKKIVAGGESLNLSTESLFDLILLKTKRIGHGLNLIKVMPILKMIFE
jgi:hypothetical protein